MSPDPGLQANRLLALLPDEELARLEPLLAMVDGRDHDEIYEPGQEVRRAYFPLTAVLSLIVIDADGRGIEMATVGREGVVGLAGALQGGSMIGETVQQIAGRMAAIDIEDLREEVERRGVLSRVIERYTVALISQIGQGVLCNRHHSRDARAARWLLASHDRVGRDQFVLTQDFLAVMLGLTRPQVSMAAAGLRRAGFITYSRGRMEILDRAGLEAAACPCYGLIQAEFARLLGEPGGPHWVAVGG